MTSSRLRNTNYMSPTKLSTKRNAKWVPQVPNSNLTTLNITIYEAVNPFERNINESQPDIL